MTDRPRLSFVATSRNDDHGGDVLRRTQSFVRLLAEQCRRHRLRAELILVDWNPPVTRAPLSQVLEWPKGDEWFEARVITVPNRVHRELRNSWALAMFQMIAKNVGIRRAQGEFICATNIDIIFSDELFEWLKSADLREGVVYRSDRWDIPNEVQLEPDLDVLLSQARERAFRKHHFDGSYVRQEDGTFENSTPDSMDSYLVWPMINRLNSLVDRAKSETLETEALLYELGAVKDYLMEQRRYAGIPRLHTNGCGDFTMLGRGSWAKLRGYPEWNVFSWAIDSILPYQAHYNGMEIVVAPDDAVHYHIEHDHGSGWSPEGAMSLWQRLNARGIPYIDDVDFKSIVFELEENAANSIYTVYCELDWGFGSKSLPTERTAAPDLPKLEARAVNQGPLDEDELALLERRPIAVENGHVAAACELYEKVELPVGEGVRIKTHNHAWGYAVVWNIADLMVAGRETWIEITYRVLHNSVQFGIVNKTDTVMLSEASAGSPGAGFKKTRLRIRKPEEVGTVICRNGEFMDAEVEIADISVLSFTGAVAEALNAADEAPPAEIAPVAPLRWTPPPEPDRVWRQLGERAVCQADSPKAWVLGATYPETRTGFTAEEPAFIWVSDELGEGVSILPPPTDSDIQRLRLDLRVIHGQASVSALTRQGDVPCGPRSLSPSLMPQSVHFPVFNGDLQAIVIRGVDPSNPPHLQLTGLWAG